MQEESFSSKTVHGDMLVTVLQTRMKNAQRKEQAKKSNTVKHIMNNDLKNQSKVVANEGWSFVWGLCILLSVGWYWLMRVFCFQK